MKDALQKGGAFPLERRLFRALIFRFCLTFCAWTKPGFFKNVGVRNTKPRGMRHQND
jgi:hypothetical protein